MNVSLMSFSKKKNSTATPSSGGSALSGTLREGCSVIRPIIGFELSRLTFANWNYAYISDFYRYYYIQDWVWDDGLWWAYMEVDPLASFKAGIGASSCYILRSASVWDEAIADSMYPTYAVASSIIEDIETPLWDADEFSEGMYVVGVIGQGATSGAVNYYAISPSNINALKTALLSTTDYIGVTEITTELLKALVNPFQYIVSATWFPYNTIPSGSSEQIKFGWWTAQGAYGSPISNFVLHKQSAMYAMAHPQAERDYMQSSPFSSYTALIAPFGEIELDAQIVANGMHTSQGDTFCNILADLYVDLVTGNGYLTLKIGDNIVAFRQGQIGVPVQLGQITQNISGSIGSALGGVGSAIMSAITGNVGAGIIGVGGSILSGIQSAYGSVKTTGVDGGISIYSIPAHIETRFNKPVKDSLQEMGRPLCDTKTISSLSGYIKTMNADIVLAGATDAEQEQVRAFMNGGFFYE